MLNYTISLSGEGRAEGDSDVYWNNIDVYYDNESGHPMFGLLNRS